MIIYVSMLLWVPLIYFVYSMGNKEEILLTEYNLRQGIQKKIPMAYAVIAFAYIIFWASMRTYVFDTTAYIYSFNIIPNDFGAAWNSIAWMGKSVGFDLITVLIKSFITKDFTIWLSIIAVISGLCVMHTFRKYSPDFFFSLFMFMSLVMYTWLMNGMRQFLAVSMLFACTHMIEKGKAIPYFAVVLLASTIHITAFFMIPVYFIARAKPWSMLIALSIIAVIVISIFAEPFFSGFETIITKNTAYGSFMSQFSADDGVNPVRVLFSSVLPIYCYIKRAEINKYSEKLPLLNICVNMSLVAAAVYFVGMFTSGILIGRIPIFAELYNNILVPYLLYTTVEKDQRKMMRAVLIVVMLLYFFVMSPTGYNSKLTGWV